jgi:hypothetical protein
MNIGPTQRRLITAVVLLHVAFFATALKERPKVDSDASSGMLVWSSMEKGSRWNSSFEPDPTNIAEDRQNFMTWWSPGQYLAVGPLHRIGLSWGVSIATATLLCSLSGMFGYWRLYASLGFAETTSAWAAAILSVVWHVTRNYGEFPGGELPLFAVSPWLLWFIFRLRPVGLTSVIPFAAVYVVGAMTKLSFCVTAAAALAGVCSAEFSDAPGGRRLLALGAKAAAIVGAAHLLLWVVFLRHGATPANIGAHGQPWWYVLPAVLALPWGSVFGLGSLLWRIFLFPGDAIFGSPTSLAPILWIFVVGFTAVGWALVRRTQLPRHYKPLLGGMAATYVLVLGILITAGAPISLEDRQFFPVGALLLPAIVELAWSGAPVALSWLARFGLTFACAYGVAALVIHARQLSLTANVGRAGITQQIISPQALAVLHELDDAAPPGHSGTLVYVPSPEISFEIRRARVLSTFDLSLSPEELRGITRHGRVPLLVVLSNPVLRAGGREEIVKRSFADYSPSGWKRRDVGEWTFDYQGTWPLIKAEGAE